MKTLTVISHKLSLVIGFFGLFSIAVMMFLTTADLIARFFFGKAITGVVEVMTYLFLVTLFSGLAYCQTQHAHIHVTMIVSKLPGRQKFILWGITSLLSAVTAGTVAVASYIQTGNVRQQNIHSMLLWIPNYPFYFFGAVCMGIFALCLLLDSVKAFLAVFNSEYAAEVSSTWAA